MTRLNKLKVLPVVILYLFSFAGCKTAATVANMQGSDSGTLVEATEKTYEYSALDIDRSDAESVARGFIGAIQNKDFDTAKELVNISDDIFFSATDLEYVVHRSKIGYLIGNDSYDVYSPTFKEINGTATYTFYTTSDYNYEYTYTVYLELDDNNQWSISKTYYAKDSETIYAPKGVRLYINDIEVPKTYKTKTENNLDIYVIPDIARRDFSTSIVSSIFGQINGTLTIEQYDPNSVYSGNNQEQNVLEVYRTITPELFNELGTKMQSIYNSIYKMMDEEQPPENLNQFIYDEKNYKFFEQYYEQGISARKSFSGNEVTHKFTDTEILEFWQNPTVQSYVYSDDTIVLNTVLHVRWTDTQRNSTCTEKICAGIKMTKAPGGDWLLNDITRGAWINLTDGLDESQGVDAW